jgi:hypothetical protein
VFLSVCENVHSHFLVQPLGKQLTTTHTQKEKHMTSNRDDTQPLRTVEREDVVIRLRRKYDAVHKLALQEQRQIMIRFERIQTEVVESIRMIVEDAYMYLENLRNWNSIIDRRHGTDVLTIAEYGTLMQKLRDRFNAAIAYMFQIVENTRFALSKLITNRYIVLATNVRNLQLAIRRECGGDANSSSRMSSSSSSIPTSTVHPEQLLNVTTLAKVRAEIVPRLEDTLFAVLKSMNKCLDDLSNRLLLAGVIITSDAA